MLWRVAGAARAALLNAAAALSALAFLAASAPALGAELFVGATAEAGKGAARCLRSALGLLVGESGCDGGGCSCNDGSGGAQHPPQQHSVLDVLGYAHTAWVGFSDTCRTAFHGKSPLTAAALLDLTAVLCVWRRHKAAHAEAAAAAAVRRAAADPADAATVEVPAPRRADLALLQSAAAHAKAAYGAPAASGDVSSAWGYLSLITVGQATRKAPRLIPPAAHLAGVQQLTGCPPSDVLAAQWVAHLHRPAFFVALDRQRRLIVVSVRGTLQLGDYATVLDAVPQPATLCGVSGHVHAGFLAAARNMLPPVSAALAAAARAAPGWPVLLTGHSLGGGVAAVLATLLMEQRQHWEQQQHWAATEAALEEQELEEQAAGPAPPPPPPPPQQQHELWSQLGELRCIGIGAAAAFCQQLGMACREHTTSVLYGADCLPMFSVLGARLLIEEVHAKSAAATVVQGLLRCAPRFGRQRRSSSAAAGGAAAGDDGCLTRTASVASSAASSSMSCEVACGGGGCRGLCAGLPADSTSELCCAEEAGLSRGGIPAHPGATHRRSSSTWSTASTASLAAFVSDPPPAGTADRGAALVPMFPPGRILWLLPPRHAAAGRGGKQAGAAGAAGNAQAGGADQPPQLVETDQSAFERFLFTTETATVHLPDWYIGAIDALAAAEQQHA